MNPRRKSRLKVILAIFSGIAVAIGLTLYALSQNIDLFYTPSEIVYGKNDDPKTKPEVGQRIRVGGMVVEGSVVRDDKSLKVVFDLNDIGLQPLQALKVGIAGTKVVYGNAEAVITQLLNIFDAASRV